MNKKTILIMFMILTYNCQKDNADYFGSEITLEEKTTIASLISNSEENTGKEFLISGVMADVCQKKGCWMELKEGEQSMLVRFKDYAFFMPKDGFGREVLAQGIYSFETYEEENAAGEIEMKPNHSFIASGVILEQLKTESN